MLTNLRGYINRSRVVCALAALLTCSLASSAALATTIRLLSLEQLTQSSSEVVQGTVTDITSFWNQNRTTIYTRVTVTPERTLKGSAPDEVTVLLPGGTVDGTTSMVVDAPELKRNQEVVFFLHRADDLRQEVDLPASVIPFQLTDLLQGVFTVLTEFDNRREDSSEPRRKSRAE